MELVAGQAELVLDCFTNPQPALCPFSSCQMSFTPPSLTVFQRILMVTQVPPTAVRLVPRHSQDAPRALWTSSPCPGSVQGQLQMLRAWSEEKHSIIPACLSQGGFTSLILLSCQAAAQQEACPCRQCSASLRACRGFLHSTMVALHTQPSSCAEISSGIPSGQPFLLTPMVSRSHTPWCVLCPWQLLQSWDHTAVSSYLSVKEHRKYLSTILYQSYISKGPFLNP